MRTRAAAPAPPKIQEANQYLEQRVVPVVRVLGLLYLPIVRLVGAWDERVPELVGHRLSGDKDRAIVVLERQPEFNEVDRGLSVGFPVDFGRLPLPLGVRQALLNVCDRPCKPGELLGLTSSDFLEDRGVLYDVFLADVQRIVLVLDLLCTKEPFFL